MEARTSLAQLTHVRDLVAHLYEALVLVILLEEGPLRWSDIGRAIHRRSHEWIDGRQITRALDALREARYVHAETDANGSTQRATHALTASGIDRARQITAIAATVDQHRHR